MVPQAARSRARTRAARANAVGEKEVRRAQELRREAPDLAERVEAGSLALAAAARAPEAIHAPRRRRMRAPTPRISTSAEEGSGTFAGVGGVPCSKLLDQAT